MMNSEKKKMLISLLNKPYSRIKIDRALRNKTDRHQNEELIVEGEEVKEYVVEHFEKQFRERKYKFENLSKEWEEEYRAKSWINLFWYQNILDPIQKEEWLAALNKAHNKLAPGVSEIGYILLKKVSVETTKEFIKFANMVLEKSKFSRK